MQVIGKETGITYFEGPTKSDCNRYLGQMFGRSKTFVLFEADEQELNRLATFDRLEKLDGGMINWNLNCGVYSYEGILSHVEVKKLFSKKVQKAQVEMSIKKIQIGLMPEAMLIMRSY